MGKANNNTLGYLGYDFQIRLLAQILTDHKFANSIIDIIEPNYFDEESMRVLMVKIKDAWDESEIIPNYDTLRIRLKADLNNEIRLQYAETILDEIKEVDLHDTDLIQEQGMKFCKQQELKKVVSKLNVLVDKGDSDNYDQAEEMIKKVLEIGDNKDEGVDVLDSIDAVLADDFRSPIPTGIPGLDEHMNGGLAKGELGVILAPFGVGKAQPLSSKVLTPNGWVKMGDIKVGDYVISRNGKPTKVTGVYPQGVRPIMMVKFNDGTETFCDEEHLWSVNTINQRNRRTKKNGKVVYLEPDNSFKVMKTVDMVDNVRVWGGRRLNYKIPNVSPVEFNKSELTIDPYLLGILLGDGCLTEHNQPHFVTIDDELIDDVKKIYYNISIKKQKRKIETNKKGKIVIVERELTKVSLLGIKDKLISLGLYGTNSTTKFIPNNYLYTSVDDRVSLLQGLIDTDGYIDKHRIEIVTTSEMMGKQIRELVLSLGGTCNISEKYGSYKNSRGEKIICKKAYRVYFSFPNTIKFEPCRLNRKLQNFKPRDKYRFNKFITSIEYSHKEEAQCIMVDNPEHLYVTDEYIVTHNTTMVTKIANSAMDLGYNVLQIFFEDMPKVIQRKHLSCWSGIELSKLSDHKEELSKLIDEKKGSKGRIMLKKFPSDGTSIQKIRQFLRQERAKGFKPDIILLDYIDCVVPTKAFKNSWDGEGDVMRQFETMLVDFDVAGWTAVQGNRSSIKSEVVESDQMGGSIKRGQIGHFIVSIAKTLDQKEDGTATLAILKSRFGKDGIIFYDIIFNNGTMEIDVTQSGGGISMLTAQKNKESEKQKIVIEAMRKRETLLNKHN